MRFGELIRANLLTETEPGRFGCHDLLRAYASEVLRRADPPEVCDEARRRVFDHYLHTAAAATAALYPGREQIPLDPPADGAGPLAFRTAADAAGWLATERPALIAAIEQGGRYGWQIATIIEPNLDRIGSWLVQHEIQTAATAAARDTGDPHATAYTERSLGFVEGRLGRWPSADRHMGRALELFTEVGDRNGAARTHRLQGFLDNQRGQFAAALDHYRQAVEIYRAIDRPGSLASVHNEIGWTWILLGEYHQALAECRQAIEQHQRYGDRSGEAAAWDSLGYAQHHLGAYEEALDAFGHALRLYEALHDRYLEADTLIHIGDSEQAAGHEEPAVEAWRRALDILDDLGHPDADAVRAKVPVA